MKKCLLTLSVLLASGAAISQIVVAGVSPASVQGNYDFTTQVNCAAWQDPATGVAYADDGTWGTFTTGGHDFNVNGYYIQGEAVLVEDGTPGLNPQGNPISQEGCNPLINNTDGDPMNDLTGKIAVIYRNTCNFTTKLLNAQNEGAIAAIIVNREDALLGMLGDAVEGINVTIPAVFISNISGAPIVASIEAGEQPIMFIGNKNSAFANDAGAVVGEFMVSPFGTAHNLTYDGFVPGIQVYNYGSVDQDVTVTAVIDGPGASADYTSSVGPNTITAGDTLSIFDGNPSTFLPWNLGIGNYPDGDYTLTYTISLASGADDFPFDNVYTTEFTVQDEIISLARPNGAGLPTSTSYPSNSTTEYNSCMMFQDPNASALAVAGLYFTAHTDTAVNQFEGAEIFLRAYQWDDAWTDLNDPGYTFDPATQNGFQALNLITFADYFPASDDEVDDVAYADFQTPFAMQDNVRYLFCLQTFESTTISFGYDNAIDYGANYSILAQPISPVFVDGSTYAAGWNGVSAASIGLKTFDPATIGLTELDPLGAMAYPNPANNTVTIALKETGNGTVVLTDLAGKVVLSSNSNFNNGQTTLDISALQSGVYVVNITMENGMTSQLNLVKK